MNLQESIRSVQASKPIFGDLFYERLFSSHPEMRVHFEDTTIEHQAAILTMQLSVLEAYSVNDSEAAALYLKVLGTRHMDRGIPAAAYPQFRDVLLESLRQFHGIQWSDSLAYEWTEAIDSSIARMLDGYHDRAHV